MNRNGVVRATLLTLLVLVLAGCASAVPGSPNFARARIGLDSVDGAVGPLRLLGVAIASPGAPGSRHIAGGSAALLLTIANDGRATDVLTGANTEVAAKIVVVRKGVAARAPQLRIAVPPGGVAVLREVTGQHLELSRLRDALRSGFSVPVTFRFRDAGAVTLAVPIRTYTDVPDDRWHEPSL